MQPGRKTTITWKNQRENTQMKLETKLLNNTLGKFISIFDSFDEVKTR